jgi:hypothetical protein
VVIIMAGITTIVAPVALRYLFRHSGTVLSPDEGVEAGRSPLG